MEDVEAALDNLFDACAPGVALGLGSVIGAVALLKIDGSAPPRPVWTEAVWPFPIDQWGKGKAFRCDASACGAQIDLYLRAKIGFCNCVTGISDDAELDRMSDFDLVGAIAPLGAGRPISVGRMQGRSRAYKAAAPNSPGKTVMSIAFNDRCDMIVATVLLPQHRPEDVEPGVLAFLNSEPVLRWAEVTLGI